MRLVNVRMSKHTRTIITVDEDEEEEDELQRIKTRMTATKHSWKCTK